MAAKKLPAFQFYPGDWMKDPAVRTCSLPARGLWMDMLCLMHESPQRGYLLTAAEQPMTIGELSRVVGASPGNTRRAWEELERSGTFSTDDDGAVYCRRMVRDEEIRQARAEAGSAGGKAKAVANGKQTSSKSLANAQQKGGSSSSSSSSSSEVPPYPPSEPDDPGDPIEAEPATGPHFLTFWNAYPRRGRKRQDKARAAWVDATRGKGADPALIVQKAHAYASSDDGRGTYCLSAWRWLEDGCWNDDPEAWSDKRDDDTQPAKPKRDYEALAKGGAA